MTYVIQWSSQINGDIGSYAPANIGKSTIDIADNTTDGTTTLTLTGKGWSGYGAIQQENFIRLMENFASESPPSEPTAGQLWYQTADAATGNNAVNTLWIRAVTAPSSSPTYTWEQVYPAVIDNNAVVTALGYTPYNSSNPSGYLTSADGVTTITGSVNEVLVNGSTGTPTSGAITLTLPQQIATTSSPTFANITITGTPTNATDVTTKGYVDAATTGLSWKNSVQCATTANITLSGLQTIDTYTTVAGDRVLVKNQTNQTQNGIYIAATGAWSRSTDTNTGLELEGAAVYVNNGSTGVNGQMNTAWTCTNGGTITIGTTNITFAQFGGGATYVAGTGISITGNTIANSGVVAITAGTDITVGGTASNPTVGLSFSPVHQGGGSGQGNNTIYIGWLGGTIGLQVDSTNFGSTWPMSITGNSATCGGYTPSASAGVANRIVLADGSGYINNTYFNSTDNSTSSGVTGVMIKAGDNYLRTGTAQAVATFISGTSMNISGNASTATTASTANALNTANSYTMAGLLVNGNINATGNIGAYYSSDGRLKMNVKPIANALAKIDQIRGVEFDWIPESVESCGLGRVHDVGVIAQEVEAVLPEVVMTRDDGTKAVKYERIIALLLQGIKELKEEVEALKAKE